MNQANRKRAQKGFGALAVILFFAAIFSMVTMSIGDEANSLLHSNFGNVLQKRANYAAYAALQKCLAEMDKVTTYDTVAQRYVTSWDPGITLTNVPVPGDAESVYTVRVDNNSTGSLGSPFTATDGTVVPAGLVYIRVEASCHPTAGVGKTFRNSVSSLGFVGQVHWQHALLGTHAVNVTNGSTVDSYRSYDPAPVSSSSATISSNSVKDGIFVNGSSNIKGRLRFGPGADASSAVHVEAGSTVSGTQTAAPSLYRIPRFKPPYNPNTAVSDLVLHAGDNLLLAPGAYRSVVVPAGARLRLKSRPYNDGLGTTGYQYFFSKTITVDGGVVSLEDDPPSGTPTTSRTEIYVGESIEVKNGGIINKWADPALNRPARCEIIFVGNGSPKSPQRMTLANGSYVESVVCGPGLDFKALSGSTFCGGVRAFDILIDGSTARWDRTITSEDNRIRGQVAWTLKGLVQEGYEGDVDIGAEYSGGY